MLLLAVFLFSAPAAFAAETGSLPGDPSSSSEASLADSSETEASSETASVESEAPSSDASSEPSSSEEEPSSQEEASSAEELPALKSFAVFDGAGGDDLTACFVLNGHQITGTVPNHVTSVSVQPEVNFGSYVVEYRPQALSEGENPNYATIIVSDGTQNVYYYISVTREASGESSASSLVPVQSVVDWNNDGVSDASTPSELDSWQPADDSSEEASSEEEVSSQASSAAMIEGSREGGGWMLPTAVILILLGVLCIAFVVCDILYTRGILKKWIIPRRSDSSGEDHAAQQTGPETADDPAQQPAEPTDSENWDEFFRDK